MRPWWSETCTKVPFGFYGGPFAFSNRGSKGFDRYLRECWLHKNDESRKEEIKTLIERDNIHHVICFGKTQYDVLSRTPSPRSYTSILKDGQIIQSSTCFSDNVKVFLTFPTGWRFIKNAKEIKAENLRRVFAAIDNWSKEIATFAF